MVKQKQFDQLERFIDAGLINFKIIEQGDNPLVDFLDCISRSDYVQCDDSTKATIKRIVSKVTTSENAMAAGILNLTPLHTLAMIFDENFAIDLAQLIIEKGSIDLQTAKIPAGGMPYVMDALLAVTGSPKLALAQYLIGQGANPGTTDSDGNNILHNINQADGTNQQVAIAQFATKHGVQASNTNNAGLNAIEVALNAQLNGLVLNVLDPDGALRLAANISLFNLLQQGRYNEILGKLNRDDVDRTNSKGHTLLYEAIVHQNHSQRNIEARKATKDLVKTLLDQGANPNFYQSGESYLDLAIRTGEYDIAKILLDRGASPDLACRPLSGMGASYSVSTLANTDDQVIPVSMKNTILQASLFTEDKLETLKRIINTLLVRNSRPPKADSDTLDILSKLNKDTEEANRLTVMLADLNKAFNQIMLNPFDYGCYSDLITLVKNYNNTEATQAACLELLKLGHQVTTDAINDERADDKTKINLHTNRALLAHRYNLENATEYFHQGQIRQDLLTARNIASKFNYFEIARHINNTMKQLGFET